MPVQSEEQSQEALAAKGWTRLPAEYRMPSQKPSLHEARDYCRKLAASHYENFHVASWFLPERLRPHFHSIYAYCRISDDLGDEVGNHEQSLALLELWEEELNACYRGETRHPVFVALAETIKACDIPKQPFADLLIAFRQDQTVTRFETMQDVMAYCKYSANPVGRLVLYASGYRDEEMFRLSDFTCSALQLANFWQDVRVDFAKDRIYLPLEDMRRFKVDEPVIESGIASGRANAEFCQLMKSEVDLTHRMFEQGLPLLQRVDRELALDLDLFTRGGIEILRAIERQHYDVLASRPSITKGTKMALAARAVSGKLLPWLRLRRGAA